MDGGCSEMQQSKFMGWSSESRGVQGVRTGKSWVWLGFFVLELRVGMQQLVFLELEERIGREMERML